MGINDLGFRCPQWTVKDVSVRMTEYKQRKVQKKETDSMLTLSESSGSHIDLSDLKAAIHAKEMLCDASVNVQKTQEECLTYKQMRKRSMAEQNVFYLNLAKKQQEAEDHSPKGLRLPQQLWDFKGGNAIEVLGVEMGSAGLQNKRAHMEDRIFTGSVSFTVAENTYDVPVAGVFDGHGSDCIAEFVRLNLAPFIQACFEHKSHQELTLEAVAKGLRRTFKWLDRLAPLQNHMHGTTATVAMVIKDYLFVANAGDSRAVFCQDNSCQTMSLDHKPYHPFIQQDIEERLQGRIVWKEGHLPRVNGVLAVACSIGDKPLKGRNGQCCVSAEPFVTYVPFPSESKGIVILASDGLWDQATSTEAARVVGELQALACSVKNTAAQMIFAALENESHDNISVVILKRKSNESQS